jgi:hypothetical protein
MMKKMNYILNADGTIKEWRIIPFDETQRFIETDASDIVLNCDKVVEGQFIKGNREVFFAKLKQKNGNAPCGHE